MAGRGLFIVLEGVDNSGKTTQSKMLAEYLIKKDIPVVLTREPGGAAVSEEIRGILVKDRPNMLDPITQTLLFYAARKEFLKNIVEPHLSQGVTVITDRFEASTYVYQGLVQGVNVGLLDTLHHQVVSQDPDLTFVLSVSAYESIRRDANSDNQGQQQVFEKQGRAFREKLCEGYNQYFLDQRQVHGNKNIFQIGGNQSIDVVHSDIAFITESYLQGRLNG